MRDRVRCRILQELRSRGWWVRLGSFPSCLQGFGPSTCFFSLWQPPSLLFGSWWHLLVTRRVPCQLLKLPSEARDPPNPPAPADVEVPGSCLRGEQHQCLFDVWWNGMERATQELREHRGYGWGECLRNGVPRKIGVKWEPGLGGKGRWQPRRDVGYTSHYNINEIQVCGAGFTTLEGQKA